MGISSAAQIAGRAQVAIPSICSVANGTIQDANLIIGIVANVVAGTFTNVTQDVSVTALGTSYKASTTTNIVIKAAQEATREASLSVGIVALLAAAGETFLAVQTSAECIIGNELQVNSTGTNFGDKINHQVSGNVTAHVSIQGEGTRELTQAISRGNTNGTTILNGLESFVAL